MCSGLFCVLKLKYLIMYVAFFGERDSLPTVCYHEHSTNLVLRRDIFRAIFNLFQGLCRLGLALDYVIRSQLNVPLNKNLRGGNSSGILTFFKVVKNQIIYDFSLEFFA